MYTNEARKKIKETNCRYFKKGKGNYPFGNTCLYRHTLPNGEEFDVRLPLKQRVLPSDEEILQQLISYLTRRNDYWIYDKDESEDIFNTV